jgi:hypothetical protein
MTTRKWLIAGIVLGLLVVGGGWWVATNRPCGSRGLRASLRVYRKTERAWDDALAITGSTPRIALAGPVASLQQVRDRARDEDDLGECFAEVKSQELQEMDSTIKTFLAFMRQDDSERLAMTIAAQEASSRKAKALDEIRKRVEPEALARDLAERAAREKEAKERKERLAADEKRRVAAEAAAAEAKLQAELKQQGEARSAMAVALEASRGEAARRQADRDQAREKARAAWLAGWAQNYVKPMAPVRTALDAMLRGRGAHCEDFRSALGRVDFPLALAAGGPDVWFQGRKVKEALEDLAANCGNNGTADLDQALSSLARALRPYGLTP